MITAKTRAKESRRPVILHWGTQSSWKRGENPWFCPGYPPVAEAEVSNDWCIMIVTIVTYTRRAYDVKHDMSHVLSPTCDLIDWFNRRYFTEMAGTEQSEVCTVIFLLFWQSIFIDFRQECYLVKDHWFFVRRCRFVQKAMFNSSWKSIVFITAINTKPQSKESNAVEPYEFALRLIIFHFFKVQDR